MSREFLFGLSALFALMPAVSLALRRDGKRDAILWSALAMAVLGPGVWSVVQISDRWHTGLSTNLWATIAVSLLLFALVAAVSRQAWRLTPLVAAYMVVLTVFALAWQHAPQGELDAAVPAGWVAVHIGLSVATYALVTIAAVSACAAFLQERALKLKRPTALTRSLPSVADCERILVRLLIAGETVLGLGLVTGLAVQVAETGGLPAIDHKVVLTITAFLVIGGLLAAHFLSGLRGRTAIRFVLLGYLLLTLGYPGVKFVTDVMLA